MIIECDKILNEDVIQEPEDVSQHKIDKVMVLLKVMCTKV